MSFMEPSIQMGLLIAQNKVVMMVFPLLTNPQVWRLGLVTKVVLFFSRKRLLVPNPNDEDDWLRINGVLYFYTTFNIDGRVCNIIFDGGSCENVASE